MKRRSTLLSRIGTLALVACSILNAAGHRQNYCTTCARDSRGRIKRSSEAKRAFRSTHPCPSTGSTRGPCSGYVIDHTRALKHGGSDTPSNMEWQTRQAAKAKDRTE